MRYLARSAPHLREVGLAYASGGATLALRHAISTSLTGLDLRNAEIDDDEFATLLCSRTGRRLRSLAVPHFLMFATEAPYAALNRPRGTSSVMTSNASGSDSDNAPNNGGDDGSNTPLVLRSRTTVATSNAGGRWRLGPETRLRRLRRVDARFFDGKWAAAERLFNGPRVAFTPYAIVPPL
jgi:hypothetical protein